MSRVTSNLAVRSATWAGLYAGVALTAASALLFQLACARLFSVVFDYRFAFLATTLALLGLPVGGLLAYCFPQRSTELFRRLGAISAANAVLTFLVLIWLLRQPGGYLGSAIPGISFAIALPFVLSGLTLALAVAEAVKRVERLRAWAFIGAGFGALLLLPLLGITGEPGAIIGSSVISASAAAVWFGVGRAPRGRALGVALALALLALLVSNRQTHLLDVRYAKGAALPAEEFVQTNSFSRVAVTRSPADNLTISIDEGARTPISRVDLDQSAADAIPSVFRLRPGAKTLVLGAGGGSEVAAALAAGSRDVTAVEINSIVANTIMRRYYAAAGQNVFTRPGVRVVVADPRNFVRRSAERYDVIAFGLTDTRATSIAGSLATARGTLWTVEAFVDLLEHLTPDGVLLFNAVPTAAPVDRERVLPLAGAAVQRFGAREGTHFAEVYNYGRKPDAFAAHWTAVGRQPLSDADMQFLRGITAGSSGVLGMRAKESPGLKSGMPLEDADVPTDNHPYAYHPQIGYDDLQPGAVGLTLIPFAAALLTLLLPPLFAKALRPAQPGVATLLPVLLLLGAGSGMALCALIQRLAVMLGHPTYGPAVLFFGLALAGAGGSYAGRWAVHREALRLCLATLAAAAAIAAVACAMGPLDQALNTSAPLIRVLAAIALLAPAGFCMGMPLPAVLNRIEESQPVMLRWAWSLHASACVAGIALGMALAIVFGLRCAMLTGAAGYALAASVLAFTVRAKTNVEG